MMEDRTTRRRAVLIVLLAALLGPWAASAAAAQEFHIVASRRSVVRAEPDTDATALVRLERGDALEALPDPEATPARALQRNSFYRVRLRDGRLGWVSRFVVRAHPGAAPGVVPRVDAARVEVEATAFHLALGAPQGHRVLFNDGYVVGYDPRLKIPSWVQYRVTRAHLAQDRPRSDAFAVDDRLPPEAQSTLTDYEAAGSWRLWNELELEPAQTTEPAYARGHLAPARDLARTEAIERSSYLLTNMAPQAHNGFNNGVWSALERRVRAWAEARGDLTVITGPVFVASDRLVTPERTESERLAQAERTGAPALAQPPTERQVLYNLVGAGDVAAPTAFFKVVVDATNPDAPEALAFIIENVGESGRDLGETLVSIDEVERQTGLDLLTNLPDELETDLERGRASVLW